MQRTGSRRRRRAQRGPRGAVPAGRPGRSGARGSRSPATSRCGRGRGAVIALAARSSSPPARSTVVLRALAGAPANSLATATITGSRQISVSVLHLPPTDSRHHYELWLMTSTTDLVPVGSFRVSGSGSVRMSAPLPAPASRYRYLDISLQGDAAGAGISSNRSCGGRRRRHEDRDRRRRDLWTRLRAHAPPRSRDRRLRGRRSAGRAREHGAC